MNRLLRNESLQVAGLQVELVRKRIKNLNLTVRGSQGQVRISAPLRVSNAEIRRFIESRRGWIQRQQQRLASLPAPPQHEYANGEQHAFMGRDYRLKLGSGARPGVRIDGDDMLLLQLPEDAAEAKRPALLERWYRRQLAERIAPLIEYYEPVMGVDVAEWRIRKMKTRWGSCNIAKRRIWINLELAKLAPDCLEYIVVHEMTHLLERGHNARFYALMDRFMPHWRQPSDILRGHVMI